MTEEEQQMFNCIREQRNRLEELFILKHKENELLKKLMFP